MPLDRDETDLEDMNPTVHKDLIFELNKNSAWKSIATYMVKTNPRDSDELIDHLEQKANMKNAKKTAAEFLWSELLRRNWDIQRLSNALRACELSDALYILEGREDLVITRQPYLNTNGNRLKVGDTLSITCTATGLPPPKYQWIFGNNEITGQTSSDLNLLITSPDQEGDYQCEVSHYNRHNERVGQVCSTSVPVRIEPTPVKIVKSLAADYKVKIGEKLTLSCEAEGHPIPKYKWYKDGKLLDGENKNILQIAKFTRDDKGEYHCLASNGSSENFTKTLIKVDYDRRKATAKIALLIANSDYLSEHHENLPLVKNDVELISSQLKELGFHVMCWQNLTLKEMNNAIDLFRIALKPGCYAFFYYAGHGFKINDPCLMPVDIPENYLQKNTVRESKLLRDCLNQKPELFVGIFDMCLTKPSLELNPEIHEERSEVEEYTCINNQIIAYSTCNYNKSHERASAKNGVYVSHLSKYLINDIPISEVIKETECSVGASRDSKTEEQKPMHTVIQMEPHCYLTDTVIREISGNPTEYVTFLDKLTKFDPKTVPLKMKQCEVECQVTVKLLKPYWNVVEISVSGLEDWDIEFKNCCEEMELHTTNKGCIIYNPQRIAASAHKESLKIYIRKNGNLHGWGQLKYMKLLPKTLALTEEYLQSMTLVQR